MEKERYKMIYTKIISKELKMKLTRYERRVIDKKNENNNIRILGYDFVKNNENKGKLIIKTIFLF